jgi:uncharacterized protein with gpF-like domain
MPPPISPFIPGKAGATSPSPPPAPPHRHPRHPHPIVAPPIPETALRFLIGKKLRQGFDWRDTWEDEHAVAFTVAKAMSDDLLGDIKEALVQALSGGQTFAEFKKRLTPVLQERGWWGYTHATDPKTGDTTEVRLGTPNRLRIIYDTNMRTARAAGEWGRIEATKYQLPYLQYQLGPSLAHRPVHVQFEGLVLRATDPWWDTYAPPNGWGCKCHVRQIGQAEAAKLGGESETPKIEHYTWDNTRTGQRVQVPVGCDPGWGHNPGKAALRVRADLRDAMVKPQ